MTRFLHTADWHVGMPSRFLSDEAAARFAQARLDAVRTMGRVAREQGCAFILVCGDAFDSNLVSRRTVHQLAQALAEVSVPVYLLPGNHDPLDPATVYRREEFLRNLSDHVHVLTEPGVISVQPDVELVAAPWPSKRPTADLAAAACRSLASPAPGTVRILAAHGAVDIFRPDGHVDLSVIRVGPLQEWITQGHVHYVALGDRHSATQVGGTGRAWYPGSPEATAFDEEDAGNALVVEVNAATCRVGPVRIGRWHLIQHGSDVSGDAGVRALAEWLEGLPAKGETAVRLDLAGTVDMKEHTRLTALLDRFRDVLAGLDLPDEGRRVAVVPTDTDFGGLGLGGFAAAAVEELRARAAAEDEAGRTARDALRLAFRLAGPAGA